MAKTKRPPQTRKKLGGPRISEGGPRRDKANAVTEIQEKLTASSAVILSEYRGMTVHELAELRTGLREAGADYKVYKNTLAAIAARNAGLESLTEHFNGPTAFTFATGDPVVAAKKLSEFAKKVPTLVLKGGVLGVRVLNSADVTALGNLESREIMLAKAAGMFITPIQQAANLFAAGFNNLGSLLAQLRDKLPPEGGAPASEPPAPAPEAEAPEAEAPEAAAPEAEAREAEAPEAEAPEAEAPEAAPETETTEPAVEAAPEPAAEEAPVSDAPAGTTDEITEG